MKTLGGALMSVGIVLAVYAMFIMDVSVEVNYPAGNSFGLPSRVNNLGLMNDRQNYIILACALGVVGAILYFINSVKKPSSDSV